MEDFKQKYNNLLLEQNNLTKEEFKTKLLYFEKILSPEERIFLDTIRKEKLDAEKEIVRQNEIIRLKIINQFSSSSQSYQSSSSSSSSSSFVTSRSEYNKVYFDMWYKKEREIAKSKGITYHQYQKQKKEERIAKENLIRQEKEKINSVVKDLLKVRPYRRRPYDLRH